MVRQCACPCRFDVAPDERKYPQEDFASIAGLTKANGGNDYKYSNLREGMSFSDTRSISRIDFTEFGRRIGLPDRIVERELNRFAAENVAAEELLSRSFLSADMKAHYRASMGYRRSTLKPD